MIQTTDTTKVQKATKEVLNTSGGAQILNSSSISGAEAFRAATKADTELANFCTFRSDSRMGK